jgi:TnpA family transposase
VPTDDDSLILYHTLSTSDLLEILIRRRPPNQLGFAVQLCLMRYPGRTLAPWDSLLPHTLGFIARQLDIQTDLMSMRATNPHGGQAYCSHADYRSEFRPYRKIGCHGR